MKKIGRIFKDKMPGWALMTAVAVCSSALSEAVTAGGKHPLEATALAVLIGLLARNAGLVPPVFHAGIRMFENLLAWGIVLIGAGLDFRELAEQGPRILLIILVTMSASFGIIYALGRAFKLPSSLSTLLAVGTTICGGTAIAVTAPLIKAKEEETCYAVGTITLWGLAAILLYPKIARALGVGDMAFGVFAGTAIHSTPQVVGAGFIFSDLAGKTATAVKLVRNCFLAPLALGISARAAHTSAAAPDGPDRPRWSAARAFPWFLIGYFVLAGLHTAGAFAIPTVDRLTGIGRFLITVSMAGIGLNTSLRAFRDIGWKPLLVGLLGAIVVAGASISMIAGLL